MNNALVTLVILIFMTLAWPRTGLGQVDGTYGDCVTAFADMLDEWDASVSTTGAVSCNVSQGAALIALAGVDKQALPQPIYAKAELTKDGALKTCLLTISAFETEFALSGGDAAAWNRFLKGQGCQDAMSRLQ